MSNWTTNNIPDMTGKVVIITGANSGLGYESALALAKKNATVIMACRSMDKAQSALEDIKTEDPSADAVIMKLDLGDLSSVSMFVDNFKQQYDRLDILMNNAGVMGVPYRETVDGFETQFGVNHLGHFALTGQLMPMLMNTPDSRVVNVSSNFHRRGEMHFDDLHMRKNYDAWDAYAQSKLANMLFTLGLNKRLKAVDADTIAVAAHPGYAATNLQGKTENGLQDWLMENVFGPLLAQSSAKGALPQLRAATDPKVNAGDYYGPDFMGFRGNPVLEEPSDAAKNEVDAETLWQKSVDMTGEQYLALIGQPV